MGENNECKCVLLQCRLAASPAGASRVLHEEGSGKNINADCQTDWRRYKLANFLTVSLSITYMTFADGRKIVAPTWPRSSCEGLADMEVGCRIRVTYDKNRAGTLCVRRVERLLDHNEQKVLCSIMIPKSRL